MEARRAADGVLTLVTLNVHGAWPGWWRRERLLVSELARLGPDIVALQEVAVWWPQARWLAWRLGRRECGRYRVLSARKGGWGGCVQGLAILSRLPRITALPGGVRVTQIAAVETANGEGFVVANVHLSHGGGRGEVRLAQAQRLLDKLPTAGPAVVAGDFNAQPWGRAPALMAGRFRSAYATANGSEPAHTAPAVVRVGEHGYVLDYLWVSEGIEILSCGLCFEPVERRGAPAAASDHLGLVAQLRLPVSR